MHEWFDREYTAWEVYRRLLKRSKKYAWVLIIGIFTGMLVGGTWLPVFQLLQPALKQMQSGSSVAPAEATAPQPTAVASQPKASAASAVPDQKKDDRFSKIIAQVDQVGKRFGVRLVDDNGQLRMSFFVMMLMILPLALLFRLLMLYANDYALQWAGLRVVRDLRNEMFDHLQNQSLKFFGRMDVGQIMSRCNGDPGTVQVVITNTFSDMCRAPFEVAASIGFVIYFAIENDLLEMIALALIGYPLAMGPLFWIGRKIRNYARQAMERGAVLGSNMLENLTGIRVVKAYHTEEAEKQKYYATNQECVKIAMRSVRVALIVTPLMEASTVMLSVIFLCICFWRGKTLADIIPLLTPFIVAYKPLKSLGRIQTSLESGRAALTRIFSFLDLDTALPLAAHPVRKQTFDNALVFEHVNFWYNRADRQIVKDASFVLARGKTVAVVGSTGSGKTTLANLLARFYDPTEGRVLMDGIDLRELDMKDLRKMIGVVTQETILFNTTIAANIAYGTAGATREQVEMAAKMANAHPFISQHPDGYNRIVGDKGFVLSGGERQRVAIARAILKNPPILILDEATSALDTVTELQVQEAITRLMENRTVFVIAHRLSTVKHADTILVMDQGSIIEKGSHDELYAQGGVYRNLCDVQKSVK